jgi:hypothetical protein
MKQDKSTVKPTQHVGPVEPTWKGIYELGWCEICSTAVITCGICGNSSCGSGGCNHCRRDFDQFNLQKTSVQEYLSPEESLVFEKSLRIKKHILETLGPGEEQIDWLKLAKEGRLSDEDSKMFLGVNKPQVE